MTVQITVSFFTDFFQQVLIINRANKFDTLIFLKTGFLTKLLIELVMLYVCDNNEVFFSLATHKLCDHSLIVVLRNKTANNQIIIAAVDIELRIPLVQLFLIALRAVGICAVRNKRGILHPTTISIFDVFLDIDRIADCQIAVLYKTLFAIPQKSFGRSAPLTALPLQPIWVAVNLCTKFVQLFGVRNQQRSNSASQNTDDYFLLRMLFCPFFHLIQNQTHMENASGSAG